MATEIEEIEDEMDEESPCLSCAKLREVNKNLLCDQLVVLVVIVSHILVRNSYTQFSLLSILRCSRLDHHSLSST